jgi:hypothetical protein
VEYEKNIQSLTRFYTGQSEEHYVDHSGESYIGQSGGGHLGQNEAGFIHSVEDHIDHSKGGFLSQNGDGQKEENYTCESRKDHTHESGIGMLNDIAEHSDDSEILDVDQIDHQVERTGAQLKEKCIQLKRKNMVSLLNPDKSLCSPRKERRIESNSKTPSTQQKYSIPASLGTFESEQAQVTDKSVVVTSESDYMNQHNVIIQNSSLQSTTQSVSTDKGVVVTSESDSMNHHNSMIENSSLQSTTQSVSTNKCVVVTSESDSMNHHNAMIENSSLQSTTQSVPNVYNIKKVLYDPKTGKYKIFCPIIPAMRKRDLKSDSSIQQFAVVLKNGRFEIVSKDQQLLSNFEKQCSSVLSTNQAGSSQNQHSTAVFPNKSSVDSENCRVPVVSKNQQSSDGSQKHHVPVVFTTQQSQNCVEPVVSKTDQSLVDPRTCQDPVMCLNQTSSQDTDSKRCSVQSTLHNSINLQNGNIPIDSMNWKVSTYPQNHHVQTAFRIQDSSDDSNVQQRFVFPTPQHVPLDLEKQHSQVDSVKEQNTSPHHFVPNDSINQSFPVNTANEDSPLAENMEDESEIKFSVTLQKIKEESETEYLFSTDHSASSPQNGGYDDQDMKFVIVNCEKVNAPENCVDTDNAKEARDMAIDKQKLTIEEQRQELDSCMSVMDPPQNVDKTVVRPEIGVDIIKIEPLDMGDVQY